MNTPWRSYCGNSYSLDMKHNKLSALSSQTSTASTRYATDDVFKPKQTAAWPSTDEVARKAYFSYLNEGSLPGHDVQHWLDAEAHLLAQRNLTRVHGYPNRT